MKTEFALLHTDIDDAKLADVKQKMKLMGAPKIKAVWMECHNLWAAIEGTHRLHAAKSLGLMPIIDPVGYSDEAHENHAECGDYDCSISSICDRVGNRWVSYLTFCDDCCAN
jgi:hypothetical protein